LDKVEFGGSSFLDCRFAGEVREVIFYRRTLQAEELPDNEMKRVDFSNARLRWTAFRDLNLDTVLFPNDGEHLILRRFPRVLATLIRDLESKPERGWQAFVAVLRDYQKWLGPAQDIGVINTLDLAEVVGPDDLPAALQAIEAASREAQRALH
jgi:hypothetical protein